MRLPSSSISVDRKSVVNARGERTKLYVGNLAETVTEFDLLKTCRKYGEVIGQDFLWHRSGPLMGRPRGFAFVEYATEAQALKALSRLPGFMLQGRPLRVNFIDPSRPDDPISMSMSSSSSSSSSSPPPSSFSFSELEREDGLEPSSSSQSQSQSSEPKDQASEIAETDAHIRALMNRLKQADSAFSTPTTPSVSSSQHDRGRGGQKSRDNFRSDSRGGRGGYHHHHQGQRRDRGHSSSSSSSSSFSFSFPQPAPAAVSFPRPQQINERETNGGLKDPASERFHVVPTSHQQDVFRKVKKQDRDALLSRPY